MKDACRGEITEEMKKVAEIEEISPEVLRRRIASGRVIIPKNIIREIEPIGIGEGLKVKVNANVGTSPDYVDLEEELRKALVAVKYGADTIMDLSIGGDIDLIRRKILQSVNVPVGTVPIYQAAMEATKKGQDIVDMNSDDIFNAIRKHAADGVDFVTVHCALTLDALKIVKKSDRILRMVSRGGSLLAAWMIHNEKENPLYAEFDYLLEIAKEYDLTLSIGDALRPGSLADASDIPQMLELLVAADLVRKARNNHVQVMVEGPGHLPLDQIEANVKLEKAVCDGAPYYLLGPLVTDIAAGYDHIAAAIGGAVAAWAGADLLCYVTPGEHLCLPDVEDVREGVIAAKIAAHAADVARGFGMKRDEEMSEARRRFDWEKQIALSLDPEKAREMRSRKPPILDPKTCSMCSQLCAVKLASKYLSKLEDDR
ncbi:MAG: phosphomethylpyrimidine synthase ThiC [Candidatus Hadarchaeales archaeon]